MRTLHGTLLVVLSTGLVALSGCSKPPETVVPEEAVHDHAADDHAGWWCIEHGVPEEECALCDTSLVEVFKAKDDWCDEHHRPDSQCFTCNPENLAKFASRYEAKFGEPPPVPTE